MANVWDELSEILSTRPGWHLETDGFSPSPIWCFGLGGACRLVISMQARGSLLYDHAADTEHPFSELDDVMAWLEVHESEYEGFTELQTELMGDLLPKAIDEWKDEGSP
jgi:hypothetical protein